MVAKKRVADLLVDVLAEAGVRRIFGVSGDSLNGITDSIRASRKLEWIHLRHEETAAFAAGAEAHLTGKLAVCAGSCGPGNLHLINGLYDCHRSRVPVLAIAAQIPSDEIGSGYFQETHPEHLFAQCSQYCELVSQPEQMPRVLEIAMQTAISKRGVAVITLPGDVALRDAVEPGARFHVHETKPTVCPSADEISALAALLNKSKKTTILAGAGCAGAHKELIELAGRLKAPIVHALRGKEFVEYDNPFSVGMTGLLGFSSGYHAMMNCDTLLMLGTDFPYQQFYPPDSTIIQIDIRGEQIGLGRRHKTVEITLSARMAPHLRSSPNCEPTRIVASRASPAIRRRHRQPALSFIWRQRAAQIVGVPIVHSLLQRFRMTCGKRIQNFACELSVWIGFLFGFRPLPISMKAPAARSFTYGCDARMRSSGGRQLVSAVMVPSWPTGRFAVR